MRGKNLCGFVLIAQLNYLLIELDFPPAHGSWIELVITQINCTLIVMFPDVARLNSHTISSFSVCAFYSLRYCSSVYCMPTSVLQKACSFDMHFHYAISACVTESRRVISSSRSISCVTHGWDASISSLSSLFNHATTE